MSPRDVDTSTSTYKPSSEDPLFAVLSTNDPPSSEQVTLTKARLDELSAELSPLHHEIQDTSARLRELMEHLNHLQTKERHLRNKVEAHRAVLAPWRRLPTEIIAEILQTAVNPGSLSFLSDKNPATDRAHFRNLRAVCRTWREVAFATQSLWTTVWVDFDAYDAYSVSSGEVYASVIRGVEGYFNHAGPTLPLNLGFRWHASPDAAVVTDEEGSENREYTRVWNLWLDYLCSQRTRWEEISWFCTTHHFQLFEKRLAKELELGTGPWKALFFQIILQDAFAEHNGTGATPSIIQTCFPELETINLNADEDSLVIGSVTPSRLLDPHSNLCKLRLEVHLDLNPYFTRVGGFTHLKKLLLACPKLHVTPVESGPTFELPNLELVVLSCPPSFSALARLYAPKLKTLQILTNEPPNSDRETTIELQTSLADTFASVISFAQQCNRTLKEFRLNCWFLKDDNMLRQLLEALTSVEEVCLDTWFRDRRSPSLENGPSTSASASTSSGSAFDTSDAMGVVDELQNSMCLPNLRRFCLHDPADEETPQPLAEGEVSQRHLRSRTSRLKEDDRALLDDTSIDSQLEADLALIDQLKQEAAEALGDPVPGVEPEVAEVQPAPIPIDPHEDQVEVPDENSEDEAGSQVGNPEDHPDFFIRGQFSWPSLASFLRSCQTRAQRNRSSNSTSGARKAKEFEFFPSAKALKAGGEEAKLVIEALAREGLSVTRETSCRVYCPYNPLTYEMKVELYTPMAN
ncbi:hypothetical protein D9611_013909 [Ephemerocybe angulata]|uniref:F-box domain-containing protein n=1 Tax=Ephemerocybe angulata TaxID=980116 RepID=A0A8H5B828_9AGAR|nr:hypothetical protein D9611_013909 [Tulosesus angulatus]